MGKYVRKPKTAGEVAVMELSQPSLGVRTRAKTLALRRQQNSSATVASAPVTGDGSYLQLRSRRVEKPPIVVNHHVSKRHKQQRQGSKKDNPNLDSRIPAGSGSNPEEEKEALLDEDEEEIFPPSGVKYAERLQFQEALMSSTVSSKMICNPFSTEASSSVLVDQAVPQPKLELVEMETKEAVESSLSFCEICVERKENDQMFTTGSCNHSYCYDCVSKHVLIRVEENTTIIRCPGVNCGAVLELDKCRPLLPEVVIHRWEDALCQEFINASQRFYCPFRDCSASLLNDGGEVIQEAECPFCHRLFCAQCYVPWHPGIGCEEFQKLNEDEREREDLMVRELAKKQKWARCPKCKYYVERTVGCPHMICRCNFQFCYGCGEEWTGNHGGCSRD